MVENDIVVPEKPPVEAVFLSTDQKVYNSEGREPFLRRSNDIAEIFSIIRTLFGHCRDLAGKIPLNQHEMMSLQG